MSDDQHLMMPCNWSLLPDCSAACIQVVRLLVQAGADLNAYLTRDGWEKYPLVPVIAHCVKADKHDPDYPAESVSKEAVADIVQVLIGECS